MIPTAASPVITSTTTPVGGNQPTETDTAVLASETTTDAKTTGDHGASESAFHARTNETAIQSSATPIETITIENFQTSKEVDYVLTMEGQSGCKDSLMGIFNNLNEQEKETIVKQFNSFRKYIDQTVCDFIDLKNNLTSFVLRHLGCTNIKDNSIYTVRGDKPLKDLLPELDSAFKDPDTFKAKYPSLFTEQEQRIVRLGANIDYISIPNGNRNLDYSIPITKDNLTEPNILITALKWNTENMQETITAATELFSRFNDTQKDLIAHSLDLIRLNRKDPNSDLHLDFTDMKIINAVLGVCDITDDSARRIIEDKFERLSLNNLIIELNKEVKKEKPFSSLLDSGGGTTGQQADGATGQRNSETSETAQPKTPITFPSSELLDRGGVDIADPTNHPRPALNTTNITNSSVLKEYLPDNFKPYAKALSAIIKRLENRDSIISSLTNSGDFKDALLDGVMNSVQTLVLTNNHPDINTENVLAVIQNIRTDISARLDDEQTTKKGISQLSYLVNENRAAKVKERILEKSQKLTSRNETAPPENISWYKRPMRFFQNKITNLRDGAKRKWDAGKERLSAKLNGAKECFSTKDHYAVLGITDRNASQEEILMTVIGTGYADEVPNREEIGLANRVLSNPLKRAVSDLMLDGKALIDAITGNATPGSTSPPNPPAPPNSPAPPEEPALTYEPRRADSHSSGSSGQSSSLFTLIIGGIAAFGSLVWGKFTGFNWKNISASIIGFLALGGGAFDAFQASKK